MRDKKTGKCFKVGYEKGQSEKYEVIFAEDVSKIVKVSSGIEAELKVIAASEKGTEIRSLKLKNNLEEEKELEIICEFKPVLSSLMEDISHPAFNNLFLKYSLSKNGDLIVKRNKEKKVFLGASFKAKENENPEFEIDSFNIKEKIEKGMPFSNKIGLVTEGNIAFRQNLKVSPGKEESVNLVLCISESEEEVLKVLENYKVKENVLTEFKIARAKAEEEARYLNLTRNDIALFYDVLPYIIHQNPLKMSYLNEFKGKEFKQSDFWKYGISGDLPIILVTVKEINDVYIARGMLKIHETLRAKGIKTDLCILDYEKNIYEQFVKEQIMQEILNMQIGYLIGVSSGIFLLNANEIEDEDLLKFKANLWIQGSKGSIKEQIREMEEEK